ncbi:MAG: hypothetical protein IM638_13055 [Bacteroidetes bacterium]|nr:hypothetical protein [Bacteroidota bacterium]
MVFSEIEAKVKNQLAGSTFFITQNDLPGIATEKMFRDFFPTLRLDLTLVNAAYSESEIVVSGTLQQEFLGVSNLRAQLFFSVKDDSPRLRIRFSNFPEDWHIAKSIPLLADTAVAEPPYFQPVFELDSANENPLPEDFQLPWGYKPDPIIAETSIKRGLTFEAKVALRNLPPSFSWLALSSTVEHITIGGPIEIRDGFPKLWFSSSSWDFGINDMTLPLVLQVVALLPDGNAFRGNDVPVDFGRLETYINRTLNGQLFRIPLAASFGAMQTLFLNLESDFGINTQPLLLSDLAALIGLPEADSLFPEFFPQPENLSLQKIGFDLLTDPPGLQSAYAEIATSSVIRLFTNRLVLSGMSAKFILSADEDGLPSGSAVLFMKAAFLGNEMEGYLTLPQGDLGCYIAEGQTVDLKPLVQNILGVELDEMPDAVCTDFNFGASVTEQTFSLSGEIQQNWNINLGGEVAVFKKLQFEIQRDREELPAETEEAPIVYTYPVSGRIYGELQIDEILFYASAYLNSAAEGWVFECGNYEGDLPVTKLVNSVGNAFGATAEFPIPDVSVYNLKLRFEKNTKHFSIKAYVKTNEPISIGPAVFNVITFIDLNSKKNPATGKTSIAGNIECRIAIGEALFTVSYVIGNNKLLSGAWQTTDGETISLADFVALFGIDALPELPVDFHFSKASFSYRSDKKEFTLAAVSDEFGDASLRAFQDTNKKWCFEFAMKLGSITKLPVIGEQLKELGDIVKEVSLQINSPAGTKPYHVALGVGVGLPEELNMLFGADKNGAPKYRIFKTYDSQNPGYTIIDTRFTRNETGTRLQLLDSPLQSVDAVVQNGKTWLPFDFGDCGAGRIEMPTFSYNEAARSFSASGGFEITRTLAIPLRLLKSLLQNCGLDVLNKALPDTIPLRDIRLVDASGNFRFSELNVPPAVADVLKIINSRTDKLPDRFKAYFNIAIPKALSFEIAYGQGLSNLMLKLAVPDENEPVRILLFASGAFIGLELKSILVGEAVRGKMMVLEVDAKIDFFDIPTLLAAALIPSGFEQILPPTASLHKTIVLKKLLSVIAIGAANPMPVPVFYDELSLNYSGFEGFQIRSEFRFPKPSGGAQGLAGVLQQMTDFLLKPGFLLDPNKSPFITPVNFTLGPQYVKLPNYLGQVTLGETSNLISVAVYENIAHGLNWLKTFRIEELIRSIPIDKRVGSLSFSFAFFSFNAAWLVTTGKELKDGAYQKINLSTTDIESVVRPLSISPSAQDKSLAVFLKGQANLGFVKLDAVYGLLGSPLSNFASAFRYTGTFIDFLAASFAGYVTIDPGAKANQWFIMGGAADLKIGQTSVIKGTFSVSPAAFNVQAQLDLFPDNPLVRITGEVSGALSKTKFELAGKTAVKIGGVNLMDGTVSITATGFIISGKWLTMQQQFRIVERAGFPELSGTTSFNVELDLDLLELDSVLGLIPGLSGRVNMSRIKTAVTMNTTITKKGFHSSVSGKFDFAGKSLSFASFTLTVAPSSIEEVAEKVAREVAAIIENMAVDFAAIINMAAGQIVNAAEETAAFTVNAANAAYREGEKLVNNAEIAGRLTIDAAGVAANAVSNTAQDVAKEIAQIGQEISNVKGLATSISNAAVNTLSSGIGSIKSGFTSIGGFATSIGKTAISAIGDFFDDLF